MIKNVVFDIGQVLIRFEWMKYLHSMFPKETAAAVYKSTWENPAWREMDIGLIPFAELLCRFTGSAPEYSEEITSAIARMGGCAEKQPYAVPLIETVKADGKKVYYLSNYSRYLKRANEDVLKFTELMDGGLFSFEVNCVKPDRRIYDFLCRKYGIIPEESLFVDDRQENVDAAAQLGFKTVLFRGESSISEVLETAGVISGKR